MIGVSRRLRASQPLVCSDAATVTRYRENLTHGIHAEIFVNNHTIGRVSAYYTEDRPFIIPQEESMLNTLAESLSLWLASHKD